MRFFVAPITESFYDQRHPQGTARPDVSIGSEKGVEHAVLAETAVEGKLTLLPGPSFFRRETGKTRQRIIRPG